MVQQHGVRKPTRGPMKRTTALRHLNSRIVAVLAVALLLIAILVFVFLKPPEAAFSGTVIQPPIPAAQFELRDHEGEIFSLEGARGKVVALTFLYTSCTDVCPFIGLKLKRVGEMLENDRTFVEFVVISTDPERDTRSRVADYSQALGMSDGWHYLIGTAEQLGPVWKSYFIGADIFETEEAEIASDSVLEEHGLFRGLGDDTILQAKGVIGRYGGGYDVAHSTPVWLIDGDGLIRVKHGQDLLPEDVVTDIRLLLREN